MSLSSIARKSIGALLALGVSGSVMAQSASVAVVPATINGTTAGGPTSPTSFDIRFTQAAANNVVGFQVDLCLPGADPPGNPIAAGYTLTPASVPNVSVSCVNISAPGTGPCPRGPNIPVRVLVFHNSLQPIPSGNYCTIGNLATAPFAAGTYPLDLYDELASDNMANPQPFTATDGQLIITAIPGPTIAFTPDGGNVLPGTAITMTPISGTTAQTTILASSNTANGGNPGGAGGPNGQVTNCVLGGPDAAQFTITAPATFPQTFTAGTGRDLNIRVECNRSPATDRTATLVCQVQDQSGTRDEAYTLTCPRPLPADLSMPPSGPITMPGGFVGQTVTQPLPVTVATPGETGASNATVNCTVTAGGPNITVSPASISVPPGQNTAPGFTVGCVLTAAAQTGNVQCTINDRGGTQVIDYPVNCPEGSLVPPPRPVPAGSAWSWYLLGLMTLLLGGFVAWRRLS